MITRRLLFILVILVMSQVLFSQVTYFNNSIALNSSRFSDLNLPITSSNINISLKYDHISNRFSDTLAVKSLEMNMMQNQLVRPQWFKAALVPASLIIAGTITLLPDSHSLLSKYTIRDKVLDLFPGVNTSIDDYLQYAPLAAVFGLKAAGVKSRSDFVNQAIITAKAELLMTVIVRGMKPWIASERPSGGKNSMPSGHAAQAFVSATILDMEYRDASPWISVGGYAVATTTAIYRMANNQHWISDVLIGAGIGIFTTKVVYYTHRYRWGKKNNMVILPAIYKNGGGLSFAMVL
ncbi:MAG: phosphatase PAP2 family protein [Bacteroidia bacterium]|nr:phosphatase PAP2 family protein [Bacteroidia bacterium]